LVELAAGSPGALLQQRQQWQALPEGLAQRCAALVGSDSSGGSQASGPSVSPVEALSLARDLCEALEVEQQLWLLDWWQLRLWRLSHNPSQQQRLEQLRRQLRSFVQPRLAWEVALLELSGVSGC
ncbi:MAG: DNA polymerase III subunit delta', partial [Vulcanococcus sp.]